MEVEEEGGESCEVRWRAGRDGRDGLSKADYIKENRTRLVPPKVPQHTCENENGAWRN